MKRSMVRKHLYRVMLALSYMGLSYGIAQEAEQTADRISKSPLPLPGDSQGIIERKGSFGASSSDSEEEVKEATKESRVQKARRFFERPRQKKSPNPGRRPPDSDYESEKEEPVSGRDSPLLKGPEERKEKERALQDLSSILDKEVEKWNNFGGEREDAQKAVKDLAQKFIENSPLLGQEDSQKKVQTLIQSKISKIRIPTVALWEVWGGNPN